MLLNNDSIMSRLHMCEWRLESCSTIYFENESLAIYSFLFIYEKNGTRYLEDVFEFQ